jgi:hypothetical protein
MVVVTYLHGRLLNAEEVAIKLVVGEEMAEQEKE